MPVITSTPVVQAALGAYGVGRPARSKVVSLLLLAAVCLPAVGIAAVMMADRAMIDVSTVSPDRASELMVPFTVLTMILQVLVSVFVAVQATAASRSLEHQGLTSPPRPLSRPDEAPRQVATALAALSLAVLALIVAPQVIVAVGALLAEVPADDLVVPFLRGIAQAAVLAVVLSVVSLLIASLVPRRGPGVVAVIGVLTVLGALQVVATGLADELGAAGAAWFGLLSPYSLVDGAVGAVLGGDVVTPVPGTLGAVVFVALTVAVVAGGWLVLRARYRRVAVLA